MNKQNKSVGIVQSYLRPQNIQEICETLLESNLIHQLVVSNNNPDIDLEMYLNITDKRFRLIKQQHKSGPIKRIEIAKKLNSKYFFSIDDDLFLTKGQLEYLITEGIKNTNSPHGFWGMNYNMVGEKVTFEYGVINKTTSVDILNRAYFFTSLQVKEIFSLIKKINISLSEIGPCDDVFLSFSGVDRPIIHDIGGFRDCQTSNETGIAQWRENNFDAKREAILKRLLRVKRYDH